MPAPSSSAECRLRSPSIVARVTLTGFVEPWIFDQPYSFGGQQYSGYYVTAVGNPDLKWESTREANGGIDLALFDLISPYVLLGDSFGQWQPKAQRPELWTLFNTRLQPGEHLVHGLGQPADLVAGRSTRPPGRP